MDSTDTLVFNLWRLAAIVLIVLVMTIGGCTAHNHRVISQDLQTGIDPLKVRCAHDLDGESGTICTLVATQK